MNSRLFSSFSKMIEDIPPNGIMRAARLQRRMVEDDLAQKRAMSMGEAHSVLNFCRFLEAAREGVQIASVIIPLDHLTFYRRILVKLVSAGELREESAEQFDATFSIHFFQPSQPRSSQHTRRPGSPDAVCKGGCVISEYE